MRSIAIAILAAALGGPAMAEPAPRTLRVLGETTAPPEGVPARFVIDAVIKPGEGFESEVEGWWTALAPGEGADDIEGTCVETRCALSADAGYRKLSLSADLAGPGAPGGGRVALSGEEGGKGPEAIVRFTPVTGPIAGLGELAPPDAIRAGELSDLLTWNGVATGFDNTDQDEPVGWSQRRALADWQAQQQRPGGGLVLKEDLVLLRTGAAEARARAGWTALGDPALGWTAGYPAGLLPAAARDGAGQRFASADGSAVLVVAVDPPLDDVAWDAFVDKVTEDRSGVDNRSYTRVNDDMEITFEEKGRVHVAAYHNREGGLVRLEFGYPADQREAWGLFDAVLPRSLRVGDEIRRR